MMHIAVRPPYVQVENTVEITVSHAMNDGGGVEFWREGPPEFLPVLVEGVGVVLPRLHDVARVEHGEELHAIQERVDGSEMVEGQVATPAADLSPVARFIVEEIFELVPIHLSGPVKAFVNKSTCICISVGK